MSYKARLLQIASSLYDLTVEERVKYCEKFVGQHYALVIEAIRKELKVDI